MASLDTENHRKGCSSPKWRPMDQVSHRGTLGLNLTIDALQGESMAIQIFKCN